MAQKKVANLDILGGIGGYITVDGVEHTIKDLDGDDYRVINAATEVTAYYDIAQKIVPTLGAKVNALNKEQIQAIIAIADGRVAQIEEQFPNAFGSETAAPTNPSPVST